MTSPVDLKGMVAVVTGGGRGLGRAFAQALAGVGCSVAVVARSEAELAETVGLIGRAGGQAQAFPADITDAGAVDVAFAAIEQSFGAIDLLVNSAGVIGPIAPFAETAPDAWWRSVEVNLKGPMLTSRRVLPGMIARGKGCIINLVTGVAPFAYFSGYCAGKAALIRFSECLAAEVQPHGVTVFPMGPGTVRTAMSQHSLNSPEGRKWLPWFKRIFDEGLDLPPERPAELVLRLASGRYDALSGLTLNPRDDLDEILAGLEEVERDKLYSMRLRTLPNPDAARSRRCAMPGRRRFPRCQSSSSNAAWTRSASGSSSFGPTATLGRVGSCRRRARNGSRRRRSTPDRADASPSPCASKAWNTASALSSPRSPAVEQALRLSPRDRWTGVWSSWTAQAHLLKSRTEEAIRWLEKACSANPALPYVHAYLASACGLKDEAERAAAELAEARRLSGDDRYSSIARVKADGLWRTPEVRALAEVTYFAGLRKAGMPEE